MHYLLYQKERETWITFYRLRTHVMGNLWSQCFYMPAVLYCNFYFHISARADFRGRSNLRADRKISNGYQSLRKAEKQWVILGMKTFVTLSFTLVVIVVSPKEFWRIKSVTHLICFLHLIPSDVSSLCFSQTHLYPVSLPWAVTGLWLNCHS